MQPKLKNTFFICVVFLLINSCKKESNNNFIVRIDPEFEPVVDSFVKAAADRGYNISITNLIIQYDSALDSRYCAASNAISSTNNVQKIIYVNAKLKCWQNSRQLETLLFHEMGHCLLGRDHTNEQLPNGDPKSMMYPGDISMYAPCSYPIGNDCNVLYKREYYLNELFDANTPVPEWGR